MGQVPLFWDVDELLGEPGIGITAASLAKEAGCDNFEPRSCKWILEGEGEISDINEIVAVVAAVSYCAFYLAERSIWGRNAESWAEKMKAEGPPKVLRALVNWVIGITLVLIQPSVCVAGWVLCAVALLATGATLKGDADKSVVYTGASVDNPACAHSFCR